MDRKRGDGQMSEDEEELKGASLILRSGGEQMARGERMVHKLTRRGKGPR
jgi:hypothetical protein